MRSRRARSRFNDVEWRKKNVKRSRNVNNSNHLTNNKHQENTHTHTNISQKMWQNVLLSETKGKRFPIEILKRNNKKNSNRSKFYWLTFWYALQLRSVHQVWNGRLVPSSSSSSHCLFLSFVTVLTSATTSEADALESDSIMFGIGSKCIHRHGSKSFASLHHFRCEHYSK